MSMLLQLLTFLQIEGNTDKTTEATHRKMPRWNAIDSSCFRRPREANVRSDSTSTGCFGSLFSGRGSTKSKKKVSPEEPEWLRSYTVKANVDKLAKAASDKPARRCTTPRSEELATTGFSSTVLDSSTPRQSNPTTEISVAEVATPLEKYKSSGRFFEPLREGSMENRRDSDDVNEEGKGGGNHEGKEAEKGEGLEEVENDEEDDDFEPFKLLESEWKRFACRLDQDNVATIQILFRADHTVSFGARVEFQGVPPKSPAPHLCRPITNLPPRQLFVPPPLEITGHEDAA